MSNSILLIGILSISAIAGCLIVLYKISQKEDDFVDYPIVHNKMPQFTGGFSTGVSIKNLIGKKRNGILFRPKAVNIKMHLKDKKPIQDYPLWFDKKQVDIYPIGTLDSERTIMEIYPPTSDYLPEVLKKSKIGRVLQMEIENNDQDKEEVEISRLRIKRQNEMLRKTEGHEIAISTISTIQEATDDILKSALKVKDDKKQTFISGGGNV